MKKIIIPVLLLAAIAAAVLILAGSGGEKTGDPAINVSGSIEVTEIQAGFQIPGTIVSLLLQEGDSVRKGELLARLDSSDLDQSIRTAQASAAVIESQLPQLETKIELSRQQETQQVKAAEAKMQEAQLRWESLSKGSRTEDIDRARYAAEQTQQVLEFNRREYERGENLYREGAMAAQQRDALKNQYDVSVQQHRQAQEVYKLAQAGPRTEDREAAGKLAEQAKANYELAQTQVLETKQLEQQRGVFHSQIDQARQKVREAELQRRHTKLYSPVDGTVLTRVCEPGEVVGAGGTVLTLANLSEVYMKGYVSETDLGKVRLGQSVDVSTDTFPGKVYRGEIYYIASEAEFTPKNLTTKEERIKLVYRIKIKLANPGYELKPGMIADGVIRIHEQQQ